MTRKKPLMPHRRYHPRVPPTAADHWLAHPYELATADVGQDM